MYLPHQNSLYATGVKLLSFLHLVVLFLRQKAVAIQKRCVVVFIAFSLWTADIIFISF